MKNDSAVLRQLHNIQLSVPDRDFFIHRKKTSNQQGKKKGKGFFKGSSFLGHKKSVGFDVEIAREKIKSFNNSFQSRRHEPTSAEKKELGIMSITEMNDFRKMIREAAEEEDNGHTLRALDGIVKFIDLKNSGIITNKQDIILDCLNKVGTVLHEDGGLSMFHTTWFYSIYKEYLSHYKMFKPGEYEGISKHIDKEAKDIAKKLFQKQYEIPHYLQMVSESKRDIKQLLRYAKDTYVKRSLHGQRGCSEQHINKIFQDAVKGETGKTTNQSNLNEVNVIMAYALFFTRIPMMHQLVEMIKNAIPNLNVETNLYKEKINVTRKCIHLDLFSGAYRNDGSDKYTHKLFETAQSVYNYCADLVRDNRLEKEVPKSDIMTYPFLKQAVILITYRSIFWLNKKTYIQLIERCTQILKTLMELVKSDRRLLKALELADLYEKNLVQISEQAKAEIEGERG